MTTVKLPRRQFLHLAAGAAALPAVSRIAWAQSYPTRPVRIIAGYPAGGIVDIYSRLIGQWLTERLGQSFVIENRPGASGMIAVETVARAPADGYTFLLTSSNDAYNEFIFPDVRFQYVRDIAPVANIAVSACIMAVHPSFPASSVPEFIAYAKSNPGKINFASAGIGAGQHMAGELFKIMAGVNMVHVPYRGGAPGLADLLAGQVQLMFEFMATSLAHVRSGGLRGLGVTSAARSQAIPELPAVSEFLPGFEVSGWFGLAAPKQTPTEVIQKINQEINIALANDRVKARIAELGGEARPGSATDFAKLVTADTEKWGKVIRAAHIKPE